MLLVTCTERVDVRPTSTRSPKLPDGYEPLVVEIIRFFKTGKPPVSAEQTLEIFAFMEAADESKRQGGAPVSMESVLKKAQQANKIRP